MKLDFWQLSRDPTERVVALIADRALGEGEKLLVVADSADERATISRALWDAKAEAFLANGDAAEPHAGRQPILLSATCDAHNGACYAVLADGKWRDEAAGFARVFLLFGQPAVEAARATWRQFDGREDVVRSYFEQDENGKGVKRA